MNWFPMPEYLEPVNWAIPFFIITMAIELWVDQKQKLHLYEKRDAMASLGMGIGSVVINVVMKAVAFWCFTQMHHFALFPQISWTWWGWILLIILDDFTFYWYHRMSHEIRILWAAHVNHHSSEYMNFATALRQSWMEVVVRFVWYLWLPLIGFDPLMILMMMSFSLIYQYWPHTELIRKMPSWFEFIFNTPSHHRVHHASNIKYLDRNHGGIFIIWDRLFGTFSQEDDEKPVYGITSNIHSYNLFYIAFHEFAAIGKDVLRAPGILNKLKYIFMPPGWSHDGPDLRAETLRKQWKDSQQKK